MIQHPARLGRMLYHFIRNTNLGYTGQTVRMHLQTYLILEEPVTLRCTSSVVHTMWHTQAAIVDSTCTPVELLPSTAAGAAPEL